MADSRALSASSAMDAHPPVRPAAGAGSFGRLACFVLSLGCAAAGAALALHHPLSPALAAAAALAAALLVAWRPGAWLLLVPALLPLIGLAPWSGWLTFEELDILVLAVAAGAYLRLARAPVAAHAWVAPVSSLVLFGLLLFAASLLLSTLRGIHGASGPAFGWFQGYREPMNAVRLGKSFFLAALLLPLWRAAASGVRDAGDRLAWGLSLGLGGAMLAALWERIAFTDLLDFSSDYRTTALFWEMHVGGATFDGFLALSVPFAVYMLWRARSQLQWGMAAGLVALAGYTCVTTFSRAVYFALPASLMLMFALRVRADRVSGYSDRDPPALRLALALVIGFAAAAAWIFPGSGYRGMLALLGATLLLVPVGAAMRGRSPADWLAGVAGGLGLTAAAIGLAGVVPKGPYLLYGVVWLAAGAAVPWTNRAPRGSGRARVALAASLATVGCAGLVMRHWGGNVAFTAALPVLALVLLGPLLLVRRPTAASARWHVSLAAALVVVATLVGVFLGGAYIGGRMAAGYDDMSLRATHWKQGIGTLRTPGEWAFGHGLGRVAESLFFSSPVHEQAGDWRVLHDGNQSYLVISAGGRPADFEQMLRVSQRIRAPESTVSLRFDARTAAAVQMNFEVCEKHLLYWINCIRGAVGMPATATWTSMVTTLTGPPLGHGPWYAPRLVAFAMGVDTSGGRVEIDNLRLVDAGGRDLIANGDFSADRARWFFSNDRLHMPWHMMGLFPHQLHAQGLVGAMLLIVLVAGASWRLIVGAARGHALAPALAAALLGFLLVGVSDSLLDAPRLAFLFYLLLLIALTLPAGAIAAATAIPGKKSPSTGTGAGARSGAFAMTTAVLLAALLVPPPAVAGTALPASTTAGGNAAEPLRLRVGPSREIATLAEAARRVSGRTLVEVDAGDYRGDVAVWDRGDVTLRAVGGRVRLHAAGAAAEGKAIWVVRNARLDVQGFDFTGARVADGNGAGIRFESGTLTVRDCVFSRNENGILTGNDAAATLSIEDSEFGYNGRSHSLYVGTIASLRVIGSWFHHAERGHLLKSRAARSHIAYNRLADGAEGRASYELEFPNGGVAVVVGNLIEQSAQTDNPTLVSFGAEGLRWPRNALYLVNNTLVDRRPAGGAMLRVWPGAVTVRALNNLLVGNGSLEVAGTASHNHRATADDFAADIDDSDAWRLGAGSGRVGQAIEPGNTDDGEPLRPTREYRHPRSTVPLTAARSLQPGAWQRLAQHGTTADPAANHPTRMPPVRQP